MAHLPPGRVPHDHETDELKAGSSPPRETALAQTTQQPSQLLPPDSLRGHAVHTDPVPRNDRAAKSAGPAFPGRQPGISGPDYLT